MAVKICRDCRETKLLSSFPHYSNNRGIRPMCRVCFNSHSAKSMRRRRKNDASYAERQKISNQTWREGDGYLKHLRRKNDRARNAYYSDLKTRCQHLVKSCFKRASNKQLPFDLTPELVMAFIYAQGFKCSVTGCEFDLAPDPRYARNPLAPSIDRKNNDLGYTVDNIQIVTAWYNMLKNEWTDDDVKGFIATAYRTLVEREP